MSDPLGIIEMQLQSAAERIFAGQGDPMAALVEWFYRKVRDTHAGKVEPTVFATDMLNKAMAGSVDQVLQLVNGMAIASRLAEKDLPKIKKQVMEVIRIRNNLAIMLDKSDVGDPRQFDLFRGGEIKPSDFSQ